MNILIRTAIEGNNAEVALNQFDKKLFEALSPAFPKIRINTFEGSFPGNIVDITMDIKFTKFRWISEITTRETSDKSAYFIDEGRILPFFLKSWKHKHLLEIQDGQLYIIDNIDYQSYNKLMNVLLYPMFYFQFVGRKPIYKKWFAGLYKK